MLHGNRGLQRRCKEISDFVKTCMNFLFFVHGSGRLKPTKRTAGVCRILHLTEQEELRLRSGPK